MSKPIEYKELYPFQIEVAKEMYDKGKVVNAMEQGLGKTLTTLQAVDYLHEVHNNNVTLIVTGLSVAMDVWLQEIESFHTETLHGRRNDFKIFKYDVSLGNLSQRKQALSEFAKSILGSSSPVYIIVNKSLVWEFFSTKSKTSMILKTLVCDEWHLMGLRNRKTEFYKNAKDYFPSIPHAFYLSGTPIEHGPHDLWPVLSLMYPKLFRGFWKFAETHCNVIKGEYGWEILGRPKEPKKFKEFISKFVIRKTKALVVPQLPIKTRALIPLEMSPGQSRLYNQMALEFIAELGLSEPTELLIVPNILSKLTRLRQLLISPTLFGEDNELGTALPALAELVGQELESGNAITIYTPYREAVSRIAINLNSLYGSRHPTLKIFTIMGAMGTLTPVEVAEQYQKYKGPKVLIGTIGSAVSYTANTASVGFFVGYDWSYNNMIQAEDRIHRVTNKHSVRWYYLLHKGTLDEKMLSLLKAKKSWSDVTLMVKDILPNFGKKNKS